MALLSREEGENVQTGRQAVGEDVASDCKSTDHFNNKESLLMNSRYCNITTITNLCHVSIKPSSLQKYFFISFVSEPDKFVNLYVLLC